MSAVTLARRGIEVPLSPDEKRRLGRTPLEVSSLGLGTVGIGNLFRSISDEEADATVKTAWDSGIRLFDTAPLYGHGLAELRLGRSLRQKYRDGYVVCTKVGLRLLPKRRAEIDFGGFVDAAPFELQFDYSYDGAMRAFEDSLQRLALERVDICLIHDIDVLTWGLEQPGIFRPRFAITMSTAFCWLAGSRFWSSTPPRRFCRNARSATSAC